MLNIKEVITHKVIKILIPISNQKKMNLEIFDQFVSVTIIVSNENLQI